ncbi:MAG: hypothetical protein JNM20_01205 [Rhizobiales bacterium]|nr:hypothetical protein [Hyphomicrobiales bacterium]
MDPVETIILRESWEVEPRLKELGLSRKKLLEARDIAINDAANATAFHAANAAGTYSYHAGTWALRHLFVGKEWKLDRADGIEAIRDDARKVRIAFSNVDLACDASHVPKPRTKKGAGAERAITGDLFPNSPRYAPNKTGEWQFFYLMIDQNGAAELTRPIVRGGTFIAATERIYLSTGSGDDGDGLGRRDDAGDSPVEFEPQIARK